MRENLAQNWPEYQVKGVVVEGDSSFALDDVKLLYESNEIEGCLVGLHAFDRVKGLLDKAGIPVVHLWHGYKNVLNPNQIPATDRFKINEDKYDVFILRNVCILPTMDTDFPMVSAFDEFGRMIFFTHTNMPPTFDAPRWDVVRPMASANQNVVEIDKASVLAEVHTTWNYWHSMFQNMCRLYALEETGFDGKYVLFKNKDVAQFMDILGVSKDRIVWIEADDQLGNVTYRIKEMHHVGITYPNISDNSSKVLIRMARSIINEHFTNLNREKFPKRIYIQRIHTRRLTGADEILAKYGFETIIPEEHTVLQEMAYFYMADIVVCPFGAASANSLFMRPKTIFIECFGNNYRYPCCLFTLDAGGVDYRMLVGNCPKSNATDGLYADYSLAPQLLEFTLKNAIATIESRSLQIHDKQTNALSDSAAVTAQLLQLSANVQGLRWGQFFSSAVADSKWLIDKSVTLRSDGVGYDFFYILYRAMEELRPNCILELGLGESTKLTCQYAYWAKAQLAIVEHDRTWAEFFLGNWSHEHRAGKVHLLPHTGLADSGGESQRADNSLKNVVQGKKFSLILMPRSSADDGNPYIRELLPYLPDVLDEDFFMLINGRENGDEMNAVQEAEDVLREHHIAYVKQQYAGDMNRTTCILAAERWHWLLDTALVPKGAMY
ncbi:glycosyltransferase family 61 protein [Selenomonas sp. AB3002]|uniref:glycosyltransferase family 61 protein n=1 Tax=Selenomonas sp. AB3002 TaxID=1392502 RepID=UPI0004971CD6